MCINRHDVEVTDLLAVETIQWHFNWQFIESEEERAAAAAAAAATAATVEIPPPPPPPPSQPTEPIEEPPALPFPYSLLPNIEINDDADADLNDETGTDDSRPTEPNAAGGSSTDDGGTNTPTENNAIIEQVPEAQDQVAMGPPVTGTSPESRQTRDFEINVPDVLSTMAEVTNNLNRQFHT